MIPQLCTHTLQIYAKVLLHCNENENLTRDSGRYHFPTIYNTMLKKCPLQEYILQIHLMYDMGLLATIY